MSIGSAGASGGMADFLSDRAMVRQAEQLTKLPQAIFQEAEKAAQQLVGLIAGVDGNDRSGKERRIGAGRPELTPPRQTAVKAVTVGESDPGSRKLSVLLAALAAALEASNLSKQAVNAQAAAIRDAIRQANNEKLAAEYESAQQAVADALDQLTGTKNELKALIGKVSDIEKNLADAVAERDLLVPGSPDYADADKKCEGLRADLMAEKVKLAEKSEQAQKQQDQVFGLQKAVDDLLVRVNTLGIPVPQSAVKTDMSNIARMLTLMAQLGELMLKSGESRNEAQHKFLQIQQDMRIKKLTEDAKKADEERAKAEALNKAMGCVGKILGALITAVAVIGAMFTGGASLVLAGIGLAIMAADEIYKSATGNSFMQEALKPLMSLIQPMLQFVMDKVSGLLEKLGVDAQTAKMVSMIAVSLVIAAAVTVLALTGVGGAIANVASNLLSRFGSVVARMLEKTIGKLISDVIKRSVAQVTRQMSNAMSKMFDAVSQRLKLSGDKFTADIVAKNVERAGAGLNFTNTAVTGGLDIGVKKSEQNFAAVDASIKFTTSEMNLINDMLANLMEQLKDSFAISQEFFKRISEAVNQSTSTGQAITRSIKGARPA